MPQIVKRVNAHEQGIVVGVNAALLLLLCRMNPTGFVLSITTGHFTHICFHRHVKVKTIRKRRSPYLTCTDHIGAGGLGTWKRGVVTLGPAVPQWGFVAWAPHVVHDPPRCRPRTFTEHLEERRCDSHSYHVDRKRNWDEITTTTSDINPDTTECFDILGNRHISFFVKAIRENSISVGSIWTYSQKMLSLARTASREVKSPPFKRSGSSCLAHIC